MSSSSRETRNSLLVNGMELRWRDGLDWEQSFTSRERGFTIPMYREVFENDGPLVVEEVHEWRNNTFYSPIRKQYDIRDFVAYDAPVGTITKWKPLDFNVSIERPPLQGSFKQVVFEGRPIETPQNKVNHYYNTFKKVINHELENFKQVDDLTFSFEVEVTTEAHRELLTNAYEELSLPFRWLRHTNTMLMPYLVDKLLLDDETIMRDILERIFSYIFDCKSGPLGIIPSMWKEGHLEALGILIHQFKAIRLQPTKPTRFITRGILKALEKFEKLAVNDENSNEWDCISDVKVALNDYVNKLSTVSIKPRDTYFVTFDTNKIIQCSSNTTGWRSCYNMFDGEYRNTALLSALDAYTGMIYSLTKDGEMKNRRLFVATPSMYTVGSWYPQKPTGLVNPINQKMREAIDLNNFLEEETGGSFNRSDYNETYRDFDANSYTFYKDINDLNELRDYYKNRLINNGELNHFLLDKDYLFDAENLADGIVRIW